MTDLDEELQFHLNQRIAELMAGGASREDAERLALARLGDVSDLSRYCQQMDTRISVRRTVSTGRTVAAYPLLLAAGLGSDLRHAFKSLRRASGFTVTAVGTLGFGLALCLTVMTAVNAYLIRALPFPESHRLYDVTLFAGRFDLPRDPQNLDWSSLADVIEMPIAWDLDSFNLLGAPHTEAAQGSWVTPGYMAGFGVRPVMGRPFDAGDFEGGAPAVALISHRLWRTRFGGDPAIVGRHFESYSNDRPAEIGSFAIIGVLPETFWHPRPYTDVLAPLRGPSYPYMIRLREGVSPAVAADRITALVRSANQMPAEWRAGLRSTHEAYVSTVRPLLLSLAAAAGLVLLIALANVSVLLLVRTTERHREVAVRKAIGATGVHIARAFAAEAVVLGVAATAMGLGLAQLILASMAPAMDRQLGRAVPGGPSALEMDGAVLLGACACGTLITAICALVAIWASRRAPSALALTAGQRAGSGPAQQRLRSTLIVVEVAGCLALLVGAAMMVQSGLRILGVNVGLDARNVSVGMLGLRECSYPAPANRVAFFERSEDAMRSIPGVRGVAYVNAWPLQEAPARDVGVSRDSMSTRAGFVGVTGGYFQLLGIPVTDGRTFNGNDRLGAGPVAIISETLARQLWPNGRAVGQSLHVAPRPGAPAGAAIVRHEIVGVVGDTRSSHTDTAVADVYVSVSQLGGAAAFLYVATSTPPSSLDRDVRSALATVDPNVVMESTRPLGDILDRQRAAPRFLARVLTVFAGLAAVLAVVGIYGVISYAVRQRRREIAVRMAIGANKAAITTLFLRQGLVTLGAGLVLGVGGALALGAVLQSQLFGVSPSDPILIGLVTTAFAACGLLAVLWPARVAAATDPAQALKE